jgi:hypothetical protein
VVFVSLLFVDDEKTPVPEMSRCGQLGMTRRFVTDRERDGQRRNRRIRADLRAGAIDAFEAAWVDPRHTAIQLPPVDVNKVLVGRYTVQPAVHMTRRQLWDMEVRKAWDPLTYIPYVASEGKSYAATTLPGKGRRHLRSSIQKAWISDDSGRVLEEVSTDPDGQRIIFLGRYDLPGPDGTTLHADPYQPLFHVEHAVGRNLAICACTWMNSSTSRERRGRYPTSHRSRTAFTVVSVRDRHPAKQSIRSSAIKVIKPRAPKSGIDQIRNGIIAALLTLSRNLPTATPDRREGRTVAEPAPRQFRLARSYHVNIDTRGTP